MKSATQLLLLRQRLEMVVEGVTRHDFEFEAFDLGGTNTIDDYISNQVDRGIVGLENVAKEFRHAFKDYTTNIALPVLELKTGEALLKTLLLKWREYTHLIMCLEDVFRRISTKFISSNRFFQQRVKGYGFYHLKVKIYQKLPQIKEAVMELIKGEKDKKKWKLMNAVFEMLKEIKVADTEDFKNAVTNQFETEGNKMKKKRELRKLYKRYANFISLTFEEGRAAVETLKLAYMAVEETMKKRESAKRLKSKGEDDEESHVRNVRRKKH